MCSRLVTGREVLETVAEIAGETVENLAAVRAAASELRSLNLEMQRKADDLQEHLRQAGNPGNLKFIYLIINFVRDLQRSVISGETFGTYMMTLTASELKEMKNISEKKKNHLTTKLEKISERMETQIFVLSNYTKNFDTTSKIVKQLLLCHIV